MLAIEWSVSEKEASAQENDSSDKKADTKDDGHDDLIFPAITYSLN